MTPQLEQLFHQLVDLTPDDRTAYYAGNNIPTDLQQSLERLFAFDSGGHTSNSISDAIGHAANQIVAPIATGSMLGPYKLLEVLGEGGMGVVYRAERADGELTQQVAIKVVRGGGLISGPTLERFRNERQILSRLEHPNIARLYDAGTSAGLPYFVMEYVQGTSITAYCNEKDLSIPDRLRLFRTVCEAVQYAHSNLVIHRDLKPGNILVTEQGTVKLLDFGIAKVLTENTADTSTQAFTPDYCSPEQVRGEPVSTATDVYALGCILYELLSGKRAHNLSNASASEIVEAVCHREPQRLTAAARPALQRALAGDLETIVHRAMQKDPNLRYALVDLLRRDIDSHLQGHPIAARPQTILYRTGKFLRRNQLAVTAATIATLLLIGTTVFAVNRANQAQERFNQLRKIARTFIFDFNDELQRVPGNTKATALLVSTASEYLENLSRSAGNDRELILELAAAYERLATVQGGSNINLNQRAAALESRRRAIDLRLSVAGTNVEENGKLVTIAGRITNDLKDLGRLDEAVAAGTRALEISNRLLPNPPSHLKPEVAMVHVFLARAIRRKGDLATAESHLQKADALLAASTGENAPRLTLLARLDRGQLLLHLGMLDEAAAQLQAVERDLPGVVAKLPPGRFRQATLRFLPSAWALLADIHDNAFKASLDDPKRSLAYTEKLCAEWTGHLSRDPNDNYARAELGSCWIAKGMSGRKLNPEQAVLDVRRGLEIYSQSVAGSSKKVTNDPHGETVLALSLQAAGKPDQARAAISSAVQTLREMVDRQKDDLPTRALLISALVSKAKIDHALHNREDAQKAAAEAAELAHTLTTATDLALLAPAASAYEALADLAPDPATSCQWRGKQFQLWQNWTASKSPWVARQKQAVAEKMKSCPV
ncbi:hypothetical protein F183_A37590 [Bryobacterales bacterium F-183]|nr:hypothetical protein F183_A37590 [Bryobacterales bacterium F-183]